VAQRLNRALGFPDVEESDVQFGERDIEVLKNMKMMMDVGIPLHDLISVARVYGQSLAAIADAETRLFNEYMVAPLSEQGRSVEEIEERLESTVRTQLDLLGDALDYVHRRHLAMALHNVTSSSADDGGESVAIAFVDLVDFSRLADELHGTELGELVDAYEDVVVEATTDSRVRIVKMIGDAAMLASREPEAALESAQAIVARVEGDEDLPQARAGIDSGEALPLAGDYFGRPVNVAARIVAFARPGTVVASEELVESVGPENLATSKIGTHRLKGVGRVRLFKINDPDPPEQE
jgi:adenylate cyclase